LECNGRRRLRSCSDRPSNTTKCNCRTTQRSRTSLGREALRMEYAPGRVELKMLAIVARCEGGMRTGDIAKWEWSMIDLKRFATCIVPRSKTATPQSLAIPELLRPYLRSWWELEGKPTKGPVFPVRRGETAGQHRAEKGTSFSRRLKRDLRRALKWANVE